MGLFKSAEERRIERTMQARKAIAQIRRQISSSERYEREYMAKALRAKKLGSDQQYEYLRGLIKKTHNIKIRLEKQSLALESATQVKEQVEGQHDFALAMNAVSKSIAEAFGSVDLAKTQVNFEKAMAQAQNFEERMDLFLEMTTDTMMGAQEADDAGISDRDLDRMLEQELVQQEKAGDSGISQDIADVEKAMGKLKR